MDPYNGRVYRADEIPLLPRDVQDRLVPVSTPYPQDDDQKPKTVRRTNKPKNKKAFNADVDKRRAKNKVARQSRKKNRG